MKTVTAIEELRAIVKGFRDNNERVAFVPTMGNLHAGHLKLVDNAKKLAERTVVSIFVNPTQFGQGEDYAIYPRTEQDDIAKLATAGADVVFLPCVEEMYRADALTTVTVAGLSGLHCGKSRPGHFDGVTTIVCKLLNIVQPNTALFGQKDLQQLVIVRKMVRDLNMPVVIESVETHRESSGLAMSSRNGYLSAEETIVAPLLYRTLCAARDKIMKSAHDFRHIEEEALETLRNARFQVDYVAICRIGDLQPAHLGDKELAVLAAAKLGKTRLIDNILVSLA